MTRQISIFTENKKGAMHKLTMILQEACQAYRGGIYVQDRQCPVR